MKYSTVAVFSAFVAGAAAQFGLPPCPSACIFQGGAKTECNIVDIACSCRDLAYQAQLAECMAKCPPEEAAKGAEVGAQICKDAGVEITIPSITSTVPAPTSVAPPATETASEAPAPTTTADAEPTVAPPVEDDDDEDDDDDTTSTSVPPVVVVPTTTLISSTIASGLPVPTGNTSTNGTITPPVATGVPIPDDDSGAARVAFGSLMGIAVMGAVAFAL